MNGSLNQLDVVFINGLRYYWIYTALSSCSILVTKTLLKSSAIDSGIQTRHGKAQSGILRKLGMTQRPGSRNRGTGGTQKGAGLLNARTMTEK